MVSPGLLAFAVALAGMSIASYTDVQKREVPNKISFGLIAAMIILRAIYALQENNLFYLWLSLGIGAAFFGMGLLFFYAQQWGGADVKLLAVLGIGFATIYPEFRPILPVSWPFFITILMNFFFIAVAYSIVYSLILAVSNKRVFPDFKASLNRYELLFGILLMITIFILGRYEKILYALLAAPVFWFLTKFLRSVDKNCMYKKTKVDKLVEFDVPEHDIKSGKKIIVNSKDPNGITLEQIAQLKKYVRAGKLKNEFNVKWGIPLIPVFPITLVASLYFGDIYFALVRWIVFGRIIF
ncbi:TPA: prepilin peptidase [archaeon]|uniref:Prepilin peptidase n=1 Tax=Candidatus Naiadarchaeum limnaeum TaxID=2756139 RepID=A0A832VA41_9ARCH|nr:prepilin peptidase [Candidatus Naiadarchaeales archaeon SRR2090153.bin1042]HIK00361.1 prepilin peptidase [Candidatus Naiadarchaeum limnaeum]